MWPSAAFVRCGKKPRSVGIWQRMMAGAVGWRCLDNGARGSFRQTPHPPACGCRNHARSAHAQPGTADSDPTDNDSGRQSLRRTFRWTQRRGVAFAQDLLGELALAETPEKGPL